VLVGDRLMLKEPEGYGLGFAPHAPRTELTGLILSVMDSINQGGKDNVVVLNRGMDEGMTMGDVLGIYQLGETIKDEGDTLDLPDERIGEAMVYKCYNHVSFALVMNSNAPVRVFDKVGNP